ncbi:PIR Superfamily Protein [Plasmodium ovale wallikeri]|uniref:PIR Superfamily Protein n=2 Tax=Plasmodium ovale TaxID=36330 RepID=A0A1A9AHG7_PLAOA|nr:PIR Superfamily Protein [Plasmodium ovale wallikeri]SBT55542.1 PIR Superfamily Protein [Plasmodium ovale wallikeri]SBT74557.1 Plasmodium vivax Vir protein, putative [Plasmodium ovale]
MITQQCNKESELPSCKYYELLSMENGDPSNFIDECERLKRRLPYSGIFELCKKLAGNLVKFSGNEEENNPLNYNCEIIHHWLYNDIINNLSIPDDNKRIGAIIQFGHTWNTLLGNIEGNKRCEPIHKLFNSSKINDLVFMKDMHDHIYDYEILDKIDTSSGNIYNSYCRYLRSMYDKYVSFKNSCPSISEKCLQDVESLKKYDPEKLCLKLNCREEELCAKYFVDIHSQTIPRETDSFQNEESADGIGDETVTSVDESLTSTIMTAVVSSLLGLFIISFISLKFTPIRSWLNNEIVKKRNIEEYMDAKASSDMLNDYFNVEYRESEKKGYAIAYHSAENASDYNF